MSTFERINQTDPLTEWDVKRENSSIEMSDAEYLQRLRRDAHAINMSFAIGTTPIPTSIIKEKITKIKPKKVKVT